MNDTPEPVKPKPPIGRYRATRIALWAWVLPVMLIGSGLTVVSQIFTFLPRSTPMGSRMKVTGAAIDVTVLLGSTAGLILGCWALVQVPKFGTKGILIPSIIGLIISVGAFALVVISHVQGWRTKL